MVITQQDLLYSQVINVTKDYLGPAAERFISRQIETHLEKDPEALTTKDLRHLLDWIKLAMTLLTDDKKLIQKYMNSLGKLARL